MRLEVISELPTGGQRPTPLLFVHGACAGAWVWETHFLPYFACHGYAAHALSLRGHGDSEGHERLAFARLRDYVDDVEQVAGGLAAAPVVIGHSLGGMVVQKYLHRHPKTVPAAVLMASPPPHGILGSYFHMLFRHPRLLIDMSLLQMLGPFGLQFTGVHRIRRALFSDDTAHEVFYAFAPRLEAESAMAVVDLWGLDTVPSRRTLDLPVLVLGAENDAFIYSGALWETAWTYRTRPEVFADMGHALMLDHHWEQVAARILEWLEATLPAVPGRARAA
jgi:pimeloyl-ACP methyl ester carboxylesterase